MRTVPTILCFVLATAAPVWAQAGSGSAGEHPVSRAAGGEDPAAKSGNEIGGAGISAEGREALSRCRELALGAKELRGAERSRVIAEAASNYERVVAGFEQQASVAAAAAYAAAELWRRHGSLAMAEKDYLHAAVTDPGRYGQRGLLGAADMQRRQKRFAEALTNYEKAIAAAPERSRAQTARLALAKLLGSMKRTDDAIAAARVALECARPGHQVVAAANELALLLIRKGDLDAAQGALDHAASSVDGLDNGDPVVAERMQRAIEEMSARRALQRARDEVDGSAADAVKLEADLGQRR